ncbi:unnamed protein product [Timema podura]|uniref:Cation/H+ exchanger transmembrane domain-containing protein n=1 Tax=Timema podura TaxID=61482 RepID=A0ABN7NTV2_TIMPD|nr:unnamed protein product [Timema podura]
MSDLDDSLTASVDQIAAVRAPATLVRQRRAHYTWAISLIKNKSAKDDSTYPSWEPPLYRRLCPSPFCPSYRRLARVLSLCLLCLLSWGIVYVILGSTAAPGGQVFNLALLCICAHVGGWLMTLVNLPALVGMLLVGILFENVGLINVEDDYEEFVVILRHISLVIILTRAGLDLDPQALRKLYATVLKLALVPWLVECAVMAVVAHFLMDLPWLWGFLLGAIIAAVSPAVVVPCLFKLREKGYGVSKGIHSIRIRPSGTVCLMLRAIRSVLCGPFSSGVLFGDIRRYCFLSSAIIAAVSPAVVVPCLFKLREKGYGVSKGIHDARHRHLRHRRWHVSRSIRRHQELPLLLGRYGLG